MKRILNKAGGIFRALFALLMIYLIIFFITRGMNTPVRYDGDFDIYGGNFGANPIWLADGGSTAADALYAELIENDQDSILATAYAMYELSLQRIALMQGYGSRISGAIDFSALSVEGHVSTTQFRNIEKIGTPTLSATQPYKYQYQNVIMLKEMSGAELLKNGLGGAINKGVREYSDGASVWSQNGTSPYMDTLGGGASWPVDVTKQTVAEYNQGKRQYTADELREKSHYIINPDTIVADSVTITRRESEGGTCYDISFDLDCSSVDEGSAVYYDAYSITSIVGDSLSLEYTAANVMMTIYSNGYMTDWKTISKWTATFSLGKTISVQGTAQMSSSEAISYDDNETEVADFRTKK